MEEAIKELEIDIADLESEIRRELEEVKRLNRYIGYDRKKLDELYDKLHTLKEQNG